MKRGRMVQCTGAFFLAWIAGAFPQPAPASRADAPALRALAEEFFANYARGDLEGCMRLWSPRSPNLVGRRQGMTVIFADHESIEVKSVDIRDVRVDGDQATVRVTLEMTAVAVKGKRVADLGSMHRTLHCAREEAGWKIWNEVAAEDDLAAALIAAKSENDRTTLLERNGELLNVNLRKALITEGERIRQQGEYQQALEVFSLARDVADRIQDRAGVADALTNRAYVYYSQGNSAPAWRDLNEGLEIALASGDRMVTAGTLNIMGHFHYHEGHYDQAAEHFERALNLAQSLGDKSLVAGLLGNLGEIQRVRGNYPQALDLCQRSLTSAQEIDDVTKTGSSLNCLAIVHGSQGHYTQALTYFVKALKLAEGRGDRESIALIQNNIGNLYSLQGSQRQALESYQTTLGFAESSGDKSAMAFALINIGETQGALGQYSQAIGTLEKALSVTEGMGDRNLTAYALVGIAEAHMELGQYDRSLVRLERSLRLREELGQRVQMAGPLRSMAEVERRRGHHAQSLELAGRALSVAEPAEDREEIWRSRTIAGRDLLALGRPAEARRSFEGAVALIEDSRALVAGGEEEQQRFFEERISPYQEMIGLLVAGGQAPDALDYAERAKSRVLLDVLHRGKVNITKAMTSEEQEQERRLSSAFVSLNAQLRGENAAAKPDASRVAGLNERLEKARVEYEVFRAALYASHPGLKAQRVEAAPPSLADIAARLADPKSALLEYVVTDDRTYLFVLTKDPEPLQVYTIAIGRKDLAERVAAFRDRLGRRDLNVLEPAARLYDLLLAPARARIGGKTRLVIVPDGALWDLPFQALRPPGDRYLLQTCAISYAPSLTALHEMAARRRGPAASPTLLALGNPTVDSQAVERVQAIYRDVGLGPLPQAEREVRTLAELYGKDRSHVYVGAAATEERLKAEAGGSRVLHLATHGILNDASPMYSQLVLSQASDKEDGLLEAWEILNLDLHADVAVLSACETGRGRPGAGEGVIGLSWAFFVAGCPTAVVSQWKVESASTTELMLAFHRNLRAGRPKANALQAAALKLLREPRYRHPFYWAGFVVVGDGS